MIEGAEDIAQESSAIARFAVPGDGELENGVVESSWQHPLIDSKTNLNSIAKVGKPPARPYNASIIPGDS